jgi:hypothetical protein
MSDRLPEVGAGWSCVYAGAGSAHTTNADLSAGTGRQGALFGCMLPEVATSCTWGPVGPVFVIDVSLYTRIVYAGAGSAHTEHAVLSAGRSIENFDDTLVPGTRNATRRDL